MPILFTEAKSRRQLTTTLPLSLEKNDVVPPCSGGHLPGCLMPHPKKMSLFFISIGSRMDRVGVGMRQTKLIPKYTRSNAKES